MRERSSRIRYLNQLGARVESPEVEIQTEEAAQLLTVRRLTRF